MEVDGSTSLLVYVLHEGHQVAAKGNRGDEQEGNLRGHVANRQQTGRESEGNRKESKLLWHGIWLGVGQE